MTQQSSIAKELSSGHGDRRLRVLIAEGTGFSATTFSEGQIERVMDIGEERSALVLRSGAKIPVALSYEQLEQKIYEPDFRTDGPVLDLRDVTGCVARKPSSDACGAAATELKAPANTNQAPVPGDKMPDDARRVTHRAAHASEPSVGAVMSDGTIYAGISPDTGKAMYATPADASLTMTFNGAKEYAETQNTQKAHGHDDWHVPTKAELNVLFNNRAAIGGFNVTGSGPAGWYWSASPNFEWGAWGQRFSDGCQYYTNKDGHSAVRCVR